MSTDSHWHCYFCTNAVYPGRDAAVKADPLIPERQIYAHALCVLQDRGWVNPWC